MPVSQIIRRRSALFSMAAAAALLAACGQDAAETDTAETQDGEQAQSQATDLVVTASSDELESPLTAVHALPNADIVYNGVVAGAPESGGLTIFNVDGGVVAEQAGPAYGSLAASSGFQLRGSALPLIAAAKIPLSPADLQALAEAATPCAAPCSTPVQRRDCDGSVSRCPVAGCFPISSH